MRCVFPTASYQPAESASVPAVCTPPCALGTSAPGESPQSAWQRGLQFLANAIVTAVAPGECRICNNPLVHAANCPVCEGCLTALIASPLTEGCRRCSEPLGYELQETSHDGMAGLCQQCVAEPPKFVKAAAWGDYEHLRSAIHLLKFENIPALARPLGLPLAHAILSLRTSAPDALTVIPVPMYRGKRQYNQSMLLARSALRHVRKTDPSWSLRLVPTLLKRIAHTESQYLLSPAQRRENVRNAFAASDRVRSLHILLIDDVYTTGATAAECTRVLLRAGAASVHVATLARAVRDGTAMWQPPPAAARDRPLNQNSTLGSR